MLLELSDDLLEGVGEDDALALELLLQARRLGYHLLTGSREVFRELPNVVDLSDSAVAILRRARRKQMQKGKLIRTVNHRVRICRDRGPSTTIADGTRTVTLRLSHFRGLCTPAQTVILGENVRDAYLAITMAKVFAVSEGLANVALQFRPDGGGGSTTAQAFQQYRDDPRMCICVVDSDRRCPNGPVGETANAVAQEVDDGKPWAAVAASCYRASENALSTTLIQTAVERVPGRLEKIPDIEALEEVAPEVRDYCDFKNGTRLSDVYSLPMTPCGEYWGTKVAAFRGLSNVMNSCVTARQCGAQGDCECWVFPPMGDDLLKLSLTALEQMTRHKMLEALCGNTRQHWMHLGRTVFSWVCGTRPMVG